MSKYLVTLDSSMAAIAAISLVLFAVPVSGLFGWHRKLITISVNLSPNPDYSDLYKHNRYLNLVIHRNKPAELAPQSNPGMSVQEELFQLCLKNPQTLIIVTLIPDEDLALQDVVSQIDVLNNINDKVFKKWSTSSFEPSSYGRILLSSKTAQVTSKSMIHPERLTVRSTRTQP